MYNPVSEFRLKFAPRWIIDEYIQNEKNSYKTADPFKEKYVGKIPKGSDLIASHHSFEVKDNFKEDKLK